MEKFVRGVTSLTKTVGALIAAVLAIFAIYQTHYMVGITRFSFDQPSDASGQLMDIADQANVPKDEQEHMIVLLRVTGLEGKTIPEGGQPLYLLAWAVRSETRPDGIAFFMKPNDNHLYVSPAGTHVSGSITVLKGIPSNKMARRH